MSETPEPYRVSVRNVEGVERQDASVLLCLKHMEPMRWVTLTCGARVVQCQKCSREYRAAQRRKAKKQ